MSNTIGVVLATYNGELYVEQQLRSIIGQTKKPTMIIVSDGGSIDRTIEVCSAVLEDSGISSNILVSDTRLSAAANFEKALNHCDCDIIFFSDQDDVWMPNKIELLTQAMEKNDCCLAFANAFITDSSLKKNGKELWNQIAYNPEKKELLYNKGDNELLKTLIKHNIVTGMSMCISKGLKEIVCPFPENIIHDYWIALVAINYGGVLSIDVPLTLYRQHKENVVGANKSIKKSLRKRNKYLTQLIAKKDMFFRLMNISCFCNNYKEIVADYVKYIQKRIDYINIKGKLPSLLLYTTYEKYPRKVLLRDVFSKLYLSIKRK